MIRAGGMCNWHIYFLVNMWSPRSLKYTFGLHNLINVLINVLIVDHEKDDDIIMCPTQEGVFVFWCSFIIYYYSYSPKIFLIHHGHYINISSATTISGNYPTSPWFHHSPLLWFLYLALYIAHVSSQKHSCYGFSRLFDCNCASPLLLHSEWSV